jgi:ABC-type sulfate/molybdate transport systems ATPase subunit
MGRVRRSLRAYHAPSQLKLDQAVLELRDVTRAAGREPLLAGVSLSFSRDRMTAIVGLSPHGREALLRLLAGVDKPQTGSVKLDGRDVTQLRKEKRIARVGASSLPKSGEKLAKLADAEAAAKARLAGKPTAAIGNLDARLRAAVAKAKAERPTLILLDAPSTGLELDARENFITDLREMLAGAGAIVILVAGSADEALGLDGNVVVLSDAAVVQSGPAAEVFAHPANLTAALATTFPRLNTLAMTAHGGRGVLSDGSSFAPPEGLSWPEEGACTLAFHPEDMTLERAGAGCLRFVVRAAGEEMIGGRRFVRVAFANANWLTPHPAIAPHAGAVLNAFVERTRLMAFDASGKATA